MARKLGPKVKFVTGERTVGTWSVNPTNDGLGQSDERDARRGATRPGAASESERRVRHVPVRPYFHAMESSQSGGKPYFRLLHLLEELAALRAENILDPHSRSLWSAEASKEQLQPVNRCLTRLKRLNTLLNAGRGGSAASWSAHLGGVEYRIHDIVRAVLGKDPPPIPFEEWSITTPETERQTKP